VNALFLSLTAACIIHLQPKSDSLQWTIKQVYANGINGLIEASIGSPLYKMDAAWRGINLFSESCVQRQNPGNMSLEINPTHNN
jgi:hypothetical protein